MKKLEKEIWTIVLVAMVSIITLSVLTSYQDGKSYKESPLMITMEKILRSGRYGGI